MAFARERRRSHRIPLLEIYRAVQDGSVLAHSPNPPSRSCPVNDVLDRI